MQALAGRDGHFRQLLESERNLCKVLTDANRFRIELKEFHLLGIGRCAKDKANRRVLVWGTLMLIQPPKIISRCR
jgi:hypothetical protein